MAEVTTLAIDLEALKALFWTEFSRGANMNVNYEECVQVALALRYFDIVKKNNDDSKFNAALLRKTRLCCRKAGRLAANLAEAADLDTIDGDSFRQAVTAVSRDVLAAMERLKEQRGDPASLNLGGVCF